MITAAPTAADGRDVRLAIRSERLSEALVDFAVQAGVSISTPPALDRAGRAPSLQGRMSPETALARLLQGSGFSFRKVDARSFIIVPAPRPPAPPPSQVEAKPAPTTVQEIVITADKRPRAIEQTPLSVTAVSGTRLDRSMSGDTQALPVLAAGVTLTNLGPGRDKILLRGLSDGAFTGRTQSTVGVYLDESRLTYGAPDPDLQLVDVSEIEILRGPQGALYGSGSIGGVYRIVTRKPELQGLSGEVTVAGTSTLGGGAGSDIEAILNAPVISDKAGVRLVAYREADGGWLNDPMLGLRHTNSTTRSGVRASGLVEFADGWTLTVGAVNQTIDTADGQYTDHGFDRTVRVLEPHDNDFTLSYATLEGETSLGRLTSTTSYVVHEISSRYDATGAFTSVGMPSNQVGAFTDDNELDILVQETRLSDQTARFPWMLGLFGSLGRGRRDSTLDAVGGGGLTAYAEQRSDRIYEAALFGDVTFPIAPTLDLTLGGRFFATGLRTLSTVKEPLVRAQDGFRGDLSASGFAPRLTLSWRPSQQLMIYAQAAEGYRTAGFNTGGLIGGSLFQAAGGPQPLRRYNGDELWNFEIGAKLTALNERLTLNGALFLEQWRRLQTDELLRDGLPFTGNVGDAINPGLEIEASYRAAPGLEFHGHLALDDPEISRVDPSYPARVESGLPGAPRISGGGGFDFRRPFGHGAAVFAGADALYVGASPAAFDVVQRARAGGYGILNIHGGVEAGPWRVALGVNNATDSRGSTFSFGNPFRFGQAGLTTPLKPLTAKLALTRRFY